MGFGCNSLPAIKAGSQGVFYLGIWVMILSGGLIEYVFVHIYFFKAVCILDVYRK